MYRKILRALGSLQRPPPRSSWNPTPKDIAGTLNPKAHKLVSKAARHAFVSSTSPATDPTQALHFIDSLKGTSDSAHSGRIAALNSTRLMNHLVCRKLNISKVNRQVGARLQTFVSQQIHLLEPNVGQYYNTQHSAQPTHRRAFSTSAHPPPATTPPSQFSKDARANKPYEAFGTHPRKEDEIEKEEDYEWLEEVWELRTYNTDREYIYNRTTHEIRPAEEAYNKSTSELLLEYAPPTVSVKRRDVDENEDRELRWEEHAEVRGDRFPYYLNRATGECTWQFPFEDPALVPEFPTIQPHQFMKINNVNELPFAPLSKRLSAALIDLVVTGGATSLYSAVMYYEMGAKCLPGVAILMFVAYSWRDAVLDQGSVGLGKQYMGLEIVKNDGTLPGRFETVGRSCYFISYYGLLAIGVFEMPELLWVAGGLLTTDVGLLFAKGKRIGDYMFGTKVVEVQDLRKDRVKDRSAYLVAEAAAA